MCVHVVGCVLNWYLSFHIISDGSDYQEIMGFQELLFFNNETRSQCFDVTIFNDNKVELAEMFHLELLFFDEQPPPSVFIRPNITNFVIVDRDGESS